MSAAAISTAAMGATVAGGILQAYGQYQEGIAGRQAGEYNAQMAEQNATLSIQQAAEEERKLRVQNRKQIGDMRASYAASGVMFEGSPLDVLEENAATAELDALQIRHGGQVKAIGYRNDAIMSRFAGDNAYRAGRIGAAATLLNTGTKAGMMATGGGVG